MSDEVKKGPINIPIETDDDDALESSNGPDDDVIEIDGDAVELDVDLSDYEVEATEAEVVDAPGDEDFELVEPAAEEPEPVEPEPEPEPAAAEPARVAEAAPRGAEISREALFDLMTELRQKSEMIARLVDEKTDLYDKLLRKQAEFENFRKRGEREMQEAYLRARSDLMTDLLPVIDNFDLAMHHSENAGPEAIAEGVQLIYKQMMDTLGRLGLDPIEAVGQPFDPELHEAVATEKNDQVPDHTVVSVLQRGFKLGDRMLRPARVKVAVEPDAG